MNQTTASPPDYDFANKDTFVGLLRHSYRKMLMDTDGMLPAKIVSYDRVANVATVQPQVKILTTDNQLVSRASLASVPVFTLGGGGFLISFPLVAGNTGWIKASDRDISLYCQSLSESGPNTNRLHSFEDGVFFPDIMANYTIGSGDAENMVIQSNNGAVKITLGATDINMVATNIAFTSTTFTHNGTDVSYMHKHPYIPGLTGEAETGPPNE